MNEGLPNAIHLEDLTKRYGGKTVVDAVNLTIPRGSVLGLIGANGAGKSTLIKMMMGILSISSGSARLFGTDVTQEGLAIKRCTGYVPEFHQMYQWMTVGRIIDFVASFYPNWNQRFCAELQEVFSLDPAKKVKHLSKGMVAKLALLLAVSHEPKLLLLDEPMSGLDPISRDEFLDGVLQTLTGKETTVLFSSHTLDDVQRIADQIAVLHEGKLLLHQPLDQFLLRAKRLRVVLEDDQEELCLPAHTVWHQRDHRLWTLTVSNFSSDTLAEVKRQNRVHSIDIVDVGLQDLFKDIIRGQRRVG